MGNHKYSNNRRDFLKKLAGGGCASLSLVPLLSGITNLGLINSVAAANAPRQSTGYKALVCIMLSGGNDCFNMLAPIDDEGHQHYSAARTNMAIPKVGQPGEALLPINPVSTDNSGYDFGLHPQLPNIQGLFNGTNTSNGERYASFVANVGPLLDGEYTKAKYNNNLSRPYQLYSHTDQQKCWQTGRPEGRSKTGWAGRMADILFDHNANQNISMNIALNKNNIFQTGDKYLPYVIKNTGSGSIELQPGGTSFYNITKKATLDSIYEADYQGILEKAFANELKQAKANTNIFSSAIDSAPEFDEPFPSNGFGNALKMVAKTIAARNDIGDGFSKQTFYVNLDNFDHHSDLLEKHADLMEELDLAVYAFYKAMEQLNLLDDVTCFTMSDFARTLTSNGEEIVDGTDHAWGGHCMVLGGAVSGGKIFGEYPSLNLIDEHPLHVGSGRFIPTTSTDEYYADLALWFADDNLTFSKIQEILPNIGNFGYSSNNILTDRLGLFS